MHHFLADTKDAGGYQDQMQDPCRKATSWWSVELQWKGPLPAGDLLEEQHACLMCAHLSHSSSVRRMGSCASGDLAEDWAQHSSAARKSGMGARAHKQP
jgi:hypothetical protein